MNFSQLAILQNQPGGIGNDSNVIRERSKLTFAAVLPRMCSQGKAKIQLLNSQCICITIKGTILNMNVCQNSKNLHFSRRRGL